MFEHFKVTNTVSGSHSSTQFKYRNCLLPLWCQWRQDEPLGPETDTSPQLRPTSQSPAHPAPCSNILEDFLSVQTEVDNHLCRMILVYMQIEKASYKVMKLEFFKSSDFVTRSLMSVHPEVTSESTFDISVASTYFIPEN